MKKNTEKTDIKTDDEVVFTEDEKKQIKEMDEVIDEIKEEPKTNLLELFTFKNKLDNEIFDKLPLTDCQKEIMIVDILKEKYPEHEVIDEYYKKIKNIK